VQLHPRHRALRDDQQSTRGRNPVHLQLYEDGPHLVVANDATGSPSSLPVIRAALPGRAFASRKSRQRRGVIPLRRVRFHNPVPGHHYDARSES
jgi:hypothetical protein